MPEEIQGMELLSADEQERELLRMSTGGTICIDGVNHEVDEEVYNLIETLMEEIVVLRKNKE